MKALLSILLVVAVAVGGYFVFAPPPVDLEDPIDTGKAIETSPQAVVVNESKGADLEVSKAPPRAAELDQKAFLAQHEEERRKLWDKLRPMSERFLPDPDNVGPCPPAYVGARNVRVERRYLDPKSGARMWIHEDGSYTSLAFGVGEYRDPQTGRMMPKELVITGVPETPMPIAPDEVPIVDTGKK